MEDDLIRMAAFAWLEEQSISHDNVLPRSLLEAGFEYKGRRITPDTWNCQFPFRGRERFSIPDGIFS